MAHMTYVLGELPTGHRQLGGLFAASDAVPIRGTEQRRAIGQHPRPFPADKFCGRVLMHGSPTALRPRAGPRLAANG